MNEQEEKLTNPGALPDNRSDAEKAKDYVFSEIVSAVEPVVWTEKPQDKWRKFPIFSQNGSGSCVAQTLRKMYGVYIWLNTGTYVDISASHIYQRRSNKPAGGMVGVDAFKVAQSGTTLESFAPSENMTDSQMDNIKVAPFMEKVGETFKLGSYVTVSPTDIDTVASIIQKTGKAVMVWFYFTFPEWTNVPQVLNPNLVKDASSTLRHSVAAVDFTLWQGKKALIVDDSWGISTAMNGQRVITEDFFSKRNWFAAHFTNFAFEEITTTKPKYTFNTDLEQGMNHPDVAWLQKILKYEGMFPVNTSETTVFGPLTKLGVQKFQDKYALVVGGGYGRCGPLTRAKLNSLYS